MPVFNQKNSLYEQVMVLEEKKTYENTFNPFFP